MSTFTLPNSMPPVPVSLPSNLSEETLLEFPAFKKWLGTLQHSLSLQKKTSHTFHANPYSLKGIDVQVVDWFGKRPGFIKLQASVQNGDGGSLPGAVFLRGGSVAMLIILQPDDVPENTEQDKHVLLTVQPRIAAGSLELIELPAGMLDDGSFSGTAAKEIQEETGLDVPESELVNMTELALEKTEATSDAEKLHTAMYPSPGACDEAIALFLHQKRIPRSQLNEFRGKLTGLRDEGEKITLKLVRLEDLWREAGHDAKALGAWAMYHGLRGEGKI